MYVISLRWHADGVLVLLTPADIEGHAMYETADLAKHDFARACIDHQLK